MLNISSITGSESTLSRDMTRPVVGIIGNSYLINDEYRINPERSILVKADKNLEYGEVREVMDILAENRITTVMIAAGKEE